jgi:predicted ATPase
MTLAHKLSRPLTLASASYWTGKLHLGRREAQTAQELAEATITLCTEQELPFWLAGGIMLRGQALVTQGQVEEGIRQLRQGLTDYHTAGGMMTSQYWLVQLAEAYGKGEQAAEGLLVLAEALALVDDTGECWWEAEIHRLKGQLLLAQSPDNAAEAEACFHQALEVSRHQQAKSLELRAATSLARLWQSQGKRDEARELLEPVYNWFTEGHDTADLKDAKALLDELS